VLRGPEHADNYRVKVGRYGDRWYRDPLPADALAPDALDDESYPSVSIVKGASGKDWTYVALKRVAHADDLADIARKGYWERYERLKVINSLDLSAAQRRGTNVHTWAECLAYGVTPFLLPSDEGGAYFPIVDKLFAELQPELVAAETVAIHRSLNGVGYGGTTDGIFRIGGRLYMVDWKSRGEDSDHGCYPEEAGQLGGYCGAEYLIVADDDPANPHGAKRIELPELDGALVISIRPDSYEVFPVDLDRAVDHFVAMHAWWCARRSEGKTHGSKWPPLRSVDPAPTVVDELDRREGLYARHDKLTAAQQTEFAERVVNINAADLDAVEQLLDDIESPPSMLDMAQRRMAADAAREADRRLADGPADPDDVKLFELRWDLGLNNNGRRWLTAVVMEGVAAGRDFRYTAHPTQRTCDLFCALTEWATVDEFNTADDTALRAVINLAAATDDVFYAPIGKLVGSMSENEARDFRLAVTDVATQSQSQ
jgi:hypothetical protein